MKNAILLHGTTDKGEYYSSEYPSLSNSHWLPWLQKQLLIKDIPTVTPEIPSAYNPDYDVWQTEFERFDITPETILVGHSCGAGFLVRWLSEHLEVQVGKVILVAPWLDPENKMKDDFFNFIIDPDFQSRTKGTTIFTSDDDMADVHLSVKEIIEETENMQMRQFNGYGHFCLQDLKTEEFPELLEEILS